MNLLALAPRRVLMAEGSPRTAERITDAGVEVLTARGGAAEVVIERDAFANIWYVLAGDTEETVLVGSHSDCVPDGGWLDGILGVHAGLGVLAAIAGQPRRRRTLAVVDCLVTRLLG